MLASALQENAEKNQPRAGFQSLLPSASVEAMLRTGQIRHSQLGSDGDFFRKQAALWL
jgi:hypothetical protein